MRRVFAVALGMGLLAGLGIVSGQSNTQPFSEGRSSCTPFDPAALQLIEAGDVWQLRRADGAILKGFVSREDADAALAVAKRYSQLCYIGKNNGRPNPERYMMEYWK